MPGLEGLTLLTDALDEVVGTCGAEAGYAGVQASSVDGGRAAASAAAASG